jgi:hypothetical protein
MASRGRRLAARRIREDTDASIIFHLLLLLLLLLLPLPVLYGEEEESPSTLERGGAATENDYSLALGVCV